MADDYWQNLQVAGVRDRATIVDLNAFWQDSRFEYSSGDLIYIGRHYKPNMATSDSEWEVWKYTYGADGIDRIQGPLPGAWDDRATLTWS